MTTIKSSTTTTTAYQVVADTTGALVIQTGATPTTALTISSAQVVTLAQVLPEASGGTGTTVGYNGFKNRIINGAMVIDQRNAGASVTMDATGVETFVTDRFFGGDGSDAVLTMQQVSDAPADFINSVKVTVTTADASIGSSQYAVFGQRVEGLNITDLNWGTANAKTVTLSFWVKSSVTGTFGGSLRNSAANRSYVFSYSISAANTWEQKTVTVTGDTTGTWLTTNGTGIILVWSLGDGSSRTGTAGSWSANSFSGVTGQTQLISTVNATFYITGVQLEKGSTATSFDYRPYGTELALCQRYAIGYTTNQGLGAGMWYLSGYVIHQIQFPVQMRSAPTLTTNTAVGRFYITGNSVNSTAGNITINLASISGCEFFSTVSGGTAGQGTSTVVSSGLLIFSSEL